MGAMRMSRHVNAPPEVVFGVATDFANLPAFVSGIDRVEILSDGPVGEGTRFAETRTMFGRDATEEMTVSEWDPPRKFALDAISCGCQIVCVQEFTPDLAGTLVTFQMTPLPQGFRARILMALMAPLSWLMSGSVRKQISADLDDLKVEAERRAAAEAGEHADN